ncbi:MAG: hypothetical protein NWQ09_04620 [Nonlabens sp.]|nr:hypothetical protein [Nonlabens sp.]
MEMLQHHDLGYTDVFVFEDYLINQIKDGVVISYEHYDVLKNFVDTYFSDRNLVYLSNRVNSYTVNPLVHRKVSTIDNLLGVGIVVDTSLKEQAALFEKQFFDKEFEIFLTLQEGILWATALLNNNKV